MVIWIHFKFIIIAFRRYRIEETSCSCINTASFINDKL